MCLKETLPFCLLTAGNGHCSTLHLANMDFLLSSAAPQFWVDIQKSDAATRCGLQGSYWLQVEQESLLLKDLKKALVREWPYELLRRYGTDKVGRGSDW